MLIDGTFDRKFAEVAEVFRSSFAGPAYDMDTELGACVAIWFDGRLVVDLWGGYQDELRTRPWRADTIVCVQSVSKGVLATCALILIDRGLLDIEAPISRYWPEFAQKGKATLPVEWALTHQLGLPAWEHPEPCMGYDWLGATRALAQSKPDLRPGRDNTYHGYTYGYIVGEIIQRVSGRPLNQFLEEEIGGPFAVDFRFGARAGDEARIATYSPLTHRDNMLALGAVAAPEYADVMRRAIDVLDPDEDYNSSSWRRALIPAANGHTNARALARMYSVLAADGSLNGRRLVSSAAIDDAIECRWSGADLMFPMQMRVALGYMLNCPSQHAGPNPKSFGHAGLGGAYGFADREHRLSFGYAPNKMWIGTSIETGRRCERLVRAAFRCVGSS